MTRAMVDLAMPHATKRPTPTGGRKRPIPTQATMMMEKWSVLTPICVAMG